MDAAVHSGLDWDAEDDVLEPPLVAVPGPLFDYTYRHSLPKHMLDLRAAAEALSAEARSGGTVFVRENVPLLSLLGLYSLFAACLISVAAPFLPKELEHMGVGSAWTGIIFAAYPLTNLMVSPGCSIMCRRFGRCAPRAPRPRPRAIGDYPSMRATPRCAQLAPLPGFCYPHGCRHALVAPVRSLVRPLHYLVNPANIESA